MDSSEKLCLQWNDFKNNASSSFGDLRGDTDFTDVTLACDDGKESGREQHLHGQQHKVEKRQTNATNVGKRFEETF